MSRKYKEKANTGSAPSAESSAIRGGSKVDWSSANPQLIKDFASFEFSRPLGARIKIGYGNRPTSIPGIAVVNYIPTYGVSTDASSPLNVAALLNFQEIRKAKSGTPRYSHSDLQMVYAACAELLGYYHYLLRAVGLANFTTYVATNRYTMQGYLNSIGLPAINTYQDFRNIVGRINKFAKRAAALAIPNNMMIYARRALMNSKIYIDQESQEHAQTYILKPRFFSKFDATTDPNGSSLQIVGHTGDRAHPQSWDNLFAIGEEMLNALLMDDDVENMLSDMLYVYKDSELIAFPTITEDYTVEFSYDTLMLQEIKNAMPIGTEVVGSETFEDIEKTFLLKQDASKNFIVCEPQFRTGAYTKNQYFELFSHTYLNMDSAAPSLDEILEASRFCVVADWVNGRVMKVRNCGSEVVTDIETIWFQMNSLNQWGFVSATSSRIVGYKPANFETADKMLGNFRNFAAFNSFAYHPAIYLVYSDSGASSADFPSLYTMPSWDWVNTRYCDDTELSNLNEVAMYALYNVRGN